MCACIPATTIDWMNSVENPYLILPPSLRVIPPVVLHNSANEQTDEMKTSPFSEEVKIRHLQFIEDIMGETPLCNSPFAIVKSLKSGPVYGGNNNYCVYPERGIWMCSSAPCDNHPQSGGQPLIAFSSQRRQINDYQPPFAVSFTERQTRGITVR